MEEKLIIALLILAHLLNDFILQDEQLASDKTENINVLGKHCLYGWFISVILTGHYFSLQLVGVEFVIYLLHFLIDLGKEKLEEGEFRLLNEVRVFLVAQLLHLTVIISIFPIIEMINISLTDWAWGINKLILKLFPLFNKISFREKEWYIVIVVISGYIFIWTPASFIVEKTLGDLKDYISNRNTDKAGFVSIEKTKKGTNVDEEDHNPGELIGKLERTILITLVLSKNFTAIPIVFAAKSVARFSNFENKDFANYYIVGTFISLLIAVVVGSLLNLTVQLEGYKNSFIFYNLF